MLRYVRTVCLALVSSINTYALLAYFLVFLVLFLFKMFFFTQRGFFCAFRFQRKYLGALNRFEMHVFKL